MVIWSNLAHLGLRQPHTVILAIFILSYKGKFVRQQAPAREQSYRDQKVYGRKDHAWGVTDLWVSEATDPKSVWKYSWKRYYES